MVGVGTTKMVGGWAGNSRGIHMLIGMLYWLPAAISGVVNRTSAPWYVIGTVPVTSMSGYCVLLTVLSVGGQKRSRDRRAEQNVSSLYDSVPNTAHSCASSASTRAACEYCVILNLFP